MADKAGIDEGEGELVFVEKFNQSLVVGAGGFEAEVEGVVGEVLGKPSDEPEEGLGGGNVACKG